MEVLRFECLEEAIFLERPNRFAARVEKDGKEVLVHVRDSGRLGELLKRGARVLIRKREGRGKLTYELIAVYRKPYGWVFTNSGYHNSVVEELIKASVVPEFREAKGYGKEIRIGESRIDFVLVYDNLILPLEVKGCTLFEKDLCLFPDAPTSRGRKHLETLINHGNGGVVFLALSEKVRYVTANDRTDPAFAAAMVRALEEGIHVWGLRLHFDGKALYFDGRVPFVYPASKNLLHITEALKEGIKQYREQFYPESDAAVTAVWLKDGVKFNVLFWGYIHASCALYDYFYDFSIMVEKLGVFSKPVRYLQLGNAHLVTYELRRPATLKQVAQNKYER